MIFEITLSPYPANHKIVAFFHLHLTLIQMFEEFLRIDEHIAPNRYNPAKAQTTNITQIYYGKWFWWATPASTAIIWWYNVNERVTVQDDTLHCRFIKTGCQNSNRVTMASGVSLSHCNTSLWSCLLLVLSKCLIGIPWSKTFYWFGSRHRWIENQGLLPYYFLLIGTATVFMHIKMHINSV